MSDDNTVVDAVRSASDESATQGSTTAPVERSSSVWIAQAAGFMLRTLWDVVRSWTVLGVALGLSPVMYLLVTATRKFDPVTKGGLLTYFPR